MEFLLEVKDLFKQVFQASSQIDAAHNQFVLKKDKIIAQWLGVNNPKIITTIRVSLQRYDYFNYKQSKEETLLKGLLYKQNKDNNIQTNTKKLLLETLECGTTDYGMEKIQNKLIQESLSKEITRRARIEFSTSSPSANQTNKRKTHDSGSPVNSATVNNTKKKMKTNMPDIFGSIWALANSREFLIRKPQNDLDYHFTL
ncbi:29856_t:CDS:2 [Gigaspora margarita]|uniref:29856_t:CDS:1 n=1 Tax=Gigaspora margarita TaxID=4874 RepID=A0ABN7UCX5_GIGMA|nr:29856_t:CDS:2 [Gigaspora margarita]